MAVGNEWFYVDSLFENWRLVSVTRDTDRVSAKSVFEGKTSWMFSDGREMLLNGDTLFQLVRQRSGTKFPTPVFIPAQTETRFNYAFGGDVVKQQTVTKMNGCPKNQWDVSTCFRITDACKSETILGYGIGILKAKTIDCSSGNGNYTIRTLIGIKLN